ncbi:MAG: DUF58 domain-containing protein [Acidobacteria bacterium]|nr:MAG: DUF58 domain-containing protein [Acidobacteriota bacterium]
MRWCPTCSPPSRRTDVLTPQDTARLDRLTLGTAVTHASASTAGLRHARARGYGLEVTDHRPYQAGDDPRQIDWNAEARLRQLAVRVLEAEGQAHVHVALDTSRSMAAKFAWASKIAAALTYVAIARRDLAGLSLFNDALRTHVPAARGRGQLHRALGQLDAAATGGRSSLTAVFTELAHRLRPPAFVIVISDFYSPGFGLDGLGTLASRGLDPAVVQVVTDDEVEPTIRDGMRVVDLEDAGETRANVANYRRRFAEMTRDIAAHCRVHGMPFVQLKTSMTFDRALDALIQAAVIAGRR